MTDDAPSRSAPPTTPPQGGRAASADPFTPAERSAVMRRVKSTDTTPERRVRKLLTGLGARYRLHRGDLPGKPDIALPGRKLAIFVHGCFWHGHDCSRGARPPKANAAYWSAKIDRTRRRDLGTLEKLRAIGWRTLVVWECDLRDPAAVERRLARALAAEPPAGQAPAAAGPCLTNIRGDAQRAIS